MIRYYKKPELSQQPENLGQYDVGIKKRNAFYGLPHEIRFCERCVISNQRPSSTVEFQHTAASKKSTINIDGSGVCDACYLAERF